MSTYDKICLIVSDQLDLLDMPFEENMTLDELDADSFDAIYIQMAIEEDFKITVDDDEFQREFTGKATLKNITEFVKRKEGQVQ